MAFLEGSGLEHPWTRTATASSTTLDADSRRIERKAVIVIREYPTRRMTSWFVVSMLGASLTLSSAPGYSRGMSVGDSARRQNRPPRASTWLALALLGFTVSGCSLRKLAVNTLAGALSGATSSTFTTDDDPELIRDALPFALKTLEALLGEAPENTGLLISTCQGFVLYGAGFVELEADRLEATSYRRAKHQHARALKLYLRARGYCFRALDLTFPGASEALIHGTEGALAAARPEHVRLLYWTAASWGSTIAAGLDQPELVADLPAVRALLERALELEEDYDRGTLHDAMMLLEFAEIDSGVGSLERARDHYWRALELSGGTRAGTYVAWAKSVSVREQNREEFVSLLEQALEVDLEGDPQVESLTHDADCEGADLLDLVERYLEDDLVVDLEDDAALQPLVFERLVEPADGHLEDVGGQALDTGVHRLPLPRLSDLTVAGRQFGDLATPAEEGLGVAPLTGLGHGAVHVGAHRGERLEIGVEDLDGFCYGNVEALGKPVRRHAVGEPIGHHLRLGPLLYMDLIGVDAEHLGGGGGVDVVARFKRRDQAGILGEVGDTAQFDLVVVGHQEPMAFRGDERRTEHPPPL